MVIEIRKVSVMIDFQMMKYFRDKADANARLSANDEDNQSMTGSDKLKLMLTLTLILMLMGSVIIAMVLSQPVHH